MKRQKPLLKNMTQYGSGFEVKLNNVSYNPLKNSNRMVLSNINLEVKPGEFVAIIGSNAAGKSTLLKAIGGELINTTGEILVAGQKINKPINQIIDGVGIVHQFDNSDLIGHLSVAQNIAIRQLLGGGLKTTFFAITPKWKRETAKELGSKAAFTAEDLEKLINNIAGGKRQMLSVVIAIHMEHFNNPCRLLLLDEHTSRLDHVNQKKVMKYTAEEVRRIKTTAIMVTHRYQDAIDYSDRILVVNDGKIVQDVKSNSVNINQLNLWVEGK